MQTTFRFVLPAFLCNFLLWGGGHFILSLRKNKTPKCLLNIKKNFNFEFFENLFDPPDNKIIATDSETIVDPRWNPSRSWNSRISWSFLPLINPIALKFFDLLCNRICFEILKFFHSTRVVYAAYILCTYLQSNLLWNFSIGPERYQLIARYKL